MVKNNPKGFFNAVKKAKKVVVLCGTRLDDDAIGAGVGVGFWLLRQKKEADLFFGRRPEKAAEYFDKYFKIVSANKINFEKYDLIVALDCPSPQMITDYLKEGLFKFPKGVEVAAIDHHRGNSGYTKNIIFGKASSTSELVYEYLLKGYKLPKDVATALLNGITSDTGYFKWEVGDKTLSVSQELINKGADLGFVAKKTFFSRSKWELAALGYFLTHTSYNKKLGLSYLTFTKKDLRAMGISRQQFLNVRPLYNAMFARTVAEYPISLVFSKIEQSEDVAISGRSDTYAKKPFDLTKLAAKFGIKGGHPGSSGFFIKGELAEVKKKVFKAMEEMLGES